MILRKSGRLPLIKTENFKNSRSRNLLKNRGTQKWWFTYDTKMDI